MKMKMKKINLPLIIGGIIICFIIIVALFPSIFTGINPYGGGYFKTAILSGGKYIVSGAPFPPSKDFILGSDDLGRDILSLIIYGTRLTMTLGLFVVFGRFLLAIPMGIAAGFGNGPCKVIINQFSITFSTIPALIISIIVLRMKFFTGLYKSESILAFVIVLTIIGWAKLAQLIAERVDGILSRSFIKGEIAIGKGKYRIALENVIPHLSAELVILFFMEFAAALAIIMQLGIFSVFVGNLRIIDDATVSGVSILPISFEPEWASMLGTAITNIVTSPWTLIFPVIAFFISIFGFNIFGEGLRRALQNRDSMLIPKIRRFLSFEGKDFKLLNFNPIKGKFRLISIIFIAVILFAIFNGLSDMQYNFDLKNVKGIDSRSEVILGTESARSMSQRISEEFKRYGFKPISEEGFITPYKTKKEYYCYLIKAKLKGSNSEDEFIAGVDYVPGSFGNYDFSGQIYDSTELDMFSLKDYSKFNNKIVLLNGNIYSEDALNYFSKEIMKKSNAKGILLLKKKNGNLPGMIGDTVLTYPLLWVSENFVNKIQTLNNAELGVSIRCKDLEKTGRNVIGILPGNDVKLRDKAIMIGFSYNYQRDRLNTGIAKMKFELQMLKKLSLSKRDRPIIVAFWDGTLNDDTSGESYYSNNTIYESENISLYLDFTKLNAKVSDTLYFNSNLAPISRYFAWVFAHELNTRFAKNVEVKNYDRIRDVNDIIASTPNVDEVMYINGGMPIVLVASKENDKANKKTITLDDIGKIIFKTIQTNRY